MVLEYLVHLRKWWYLYLSLWLLAGFLAAYVSTVMYVKQSDDYTYTATGVYRAATAEAAEEWSYLAGLHAGTTSKVPLADNRFFEITQVGVDSEELPASIAQVLSASRSGYRDAVVILSPEATVKEVPRSYLHWLTTSTAIAIIVIGAIHAVPLLRITSREEYEPQVAYTCPLLVSNRVPDGTPQAEVAEVADAPDLKSGTH